ncbi:MAG: hypothetical protein KF823_13510 [Xanthomonadales bacterium]|nr:hypothetical protein [Xanthomonadales bacterium]
MSDAAPDGADAFVGKWLAAEPWHRLLLLFEPPGLRAPRRLLEALGFELRRAALAASDPRVSAAKLAWWAQEWQALAARAPRHPLTCALSAIAPLPAAAAAGGLAWLQAATALAQGHDDATPEQRLARWQAFARGQAEATVSWLPGGHAADDQAHGLALLAESLPGLAAPAAAGHLVLPLSALAAQGLVRADLRAGPPHPALAAALAGFAGELSAHTAPLLAASGGYRHGQLQLARRLLAAVEARPAAAWQGARQPPGPGAVLALWWSRRRHRRA